MQFGPIRQPLTLFTVSLISCSHLEPSSPASPNPAEIIIKALVFFSSAKVFIARGQYFAGMARMARSVSGISSTEV